MKWLSTYNETWSNSLYDYSLEIYTLFLWGSVIQIQINVHSFNFKHFLFGYQFIKYVNSNVVSFDLQKDEHIHIHKSKKEVFIITAIYSKKS